MGDRFRIRRRGPMEPSEDLDFTTSLHDGWVVAFLLTCAPLGRAVVNFRDDESSDLTSNNQPMIDHHWDGSWHAWPLAFYVRHSGARQTKLSVEVISYLTATGQKGKILAP
jgi:hypothetical protein